MSKAKIESRIQELEKALEQLKLDALGIQHRIAELKNLLEEENKVVEVAVDDI